MELPTLWISCMGGTGKKMTTKETTHCLNEERIAKLELSAEHRVEQLQEFQRRIDKLDNSIDKLCLNVAEVNSILSTLKWIIGISIALFGGIFCFLTSELIKLV